MTFDPQTLSIPEVSHRTARFLGVPLPPCFRIAIVTRSLAGWLKPQTGEVTAVSAGAALSDRASSGDVNRTMHGLMLRAGVFHSMQM
jgi:hypothetical protein